MVAINKFYWVIAQIKQLVTIVSAKVKLHSLKKTKELLAAVILSRL